MSYRNTCLYGNSPLVLVVPAISYIIALVVIFIAIFFFARYNHDVRLEQYSLIEGFTSSSEQQWSEERWKVVNNSEMPIQILDYNVVRADDGSYNSKYDISFYEPINGFEIFVVPFDFWGKSYENKVATEIINPEMKDGSFEMTWGHDLNKNKKYMHVVYIRKVKLKSGEIIQAGRLTRFEEYRF